MRSQVAPEMAREPVVRWNGLCLTVMKAVNISSIIRESHLILTLRVYNCYKRLQFRKVTVRVLVLDDNPDILVLVSMMLRRVFDSCQVVTGRTGVEGLAVLADSDRAPDIILSNLRMPKMDGFTFVREVRRNTDWANVHVAMMSALSTQEIRDEAQASGVESFLSKPFSYNDFAAMMTELV
jgi:two-component system chemotaxis response regulator CheY